MEDKRRQRGQLKIFLPKKMATFKYEEYLRAVISSKERKNHAKLRIP
jgi:hypothetical protein